jgi:parallel beta-helix repeat protein
MSEEVLHYIDNESRTANIIVGDSNEGDRARFNCHVEDDIAAGVALLPAGGGVLHIKRGSYTPAAAIVIPSNVTVQGEGRTIVQRPTTLNLFEIASGSSNVVIKNLELDGNGETTAGNLIDIDRSDDIVIMDCVFLDNTGSGANVADGIHIEGTDPGTSERIKIYRCRFDACRRGIYAESTDASTVTIFNLSIIDCYIEDALEEGIELVLTERSTIENTRVINSGTSGSFAGLRIRGKNSGSRSGSHSVNAVWVDGASDDGFEIEWTDESVFVKLHALNNDRDGINFNDSDRNTVVDSVCTGNGDDGIDIDAGSDRTLITGCQLTGNTDNAIEDGGTNTNLGHNVIA